MSSSRKALKWIALGCFVLIGGGICTVGSCAYMVHSATSKPADAGHAFFREVRARDDARAYARMNATYRGIQTLPQFSARLDAFGTLRLQSDSTFTGRSVSNATAELNGSLTTPQGDVPVTVTLSESNGEWFIDDIVVNSIRFSGSL